MKSGLRVRANLAWFGSLVFLVLGASADLSVTQTGSPAEIVGGDPVTYQLAVTNEGPDDATGVLILDTLPDGGIFIPEGSSPNCLPLTVSEVGCVVGSLPEGSTVDLTIVVAAPCVDGMVANEALVRGNQPDPDPSDDSSSAVVTVRTPCTRVSETLTDGGTVTTDPEGKGPQPEQGVYETTSVEVPPGISGEVSISLSVDSGFGGKVYGACPEFTDLVATTLSPPTVDEPTALVFTFDACAIPPGTKIHKTTMRKSVDGVTYVSVPKCKRKHPPIEPDPCIRKKKKLADGDFQYTILWSGILDPSWRPG